MIESIRKWWRKYTKRIETLYLACIYQIIVLVSLSAIESPWKEYVSLLDLVFWLVLVITWSLDSLHEGVKVAKAHFAAMHSLKPLL